MLKLLTREELSHAKEFVLYSNDALYVITQNDSVYHFDGTSWSFSETFRDHYESDLLMCCFKLISTEEAFELLENRGYPFPSPDETAKQNSALLDMAVHFAVDHHAGQFRKGTDIPYILHPIEVMNTLRTMNADIPLLIAGVLHDTVEDTDAMICAYEGKASLGLIFLDPFLKGTPSYLRNFTRLGLTQLSS